MYEYVHGGNIYDADGLPAQGVLDFSANINPLGIPGEVRKAIRNAIPDCVNYPDSQCRLLRKRLGETLGIRPEWIYCGNGASEILFRLAYVAQAKRTLVLAPTFADYGRAAAAAGSKVDYHQLRREDGFRVTGSLLRSVTKRTGLVVLCNPNNPTGLLADRTLLTAILDKCRANGTLCVVDECFLDFVPHAEQYTLLGLTEQYENLVVLKAFTKTHALPGIRLGYCVTSDTALLDALYLTGPDWNVSTLAQAAGVAALSVPSYLEEARQLLATERKYLTGQLRQLDCVVYDGAADYLFFYASRDPGWADLLRQRGILIRDCSNYHGLAPGYYRIAVKQRRDNRRLIKEMKEITKHVCTFTSRID